MVGRGGLLGAYWRQRVTGNGLRIILRSFLSSFRARWKHGARHGSRWSWGRERLLLRQPVEGTSAEKAGMLNRVHQGSGGTNSGSRSHRQTLCMEHNTSCPRGGVGDTTVNPDFMTQAATWRPRIMGVQGHPYELEPHQPQGIWFQINTLSLNLH